MTESELRRLLRADPARGERMLFETYYSYAYAIAYRKLCGTGTTEDAEECVIDVFLETLRRIEDIGEGSLKAYIGASARNQAINRLRLLNAQVGCTVPLDEELGAALPAPEDVARIAEQSELSRRLFESIRALGEPDAAILIQKFYYGRNAVQIARVLHMNPSTVRNRCARALKKLRTVLADLR